MRALEDLFNDVRAPASRPLVREAIAAYHAGAFRAAIVTTWVAVSLDLVGKIRELADQGVPNAGAWSATLDEAVRASNHGTLLRIERELLEDARDKFSLINAREFIELERLRADRHVCAHPAFVDVERVFEPTAEMARAHLATAVTHVLSLPPTPGRHALVRFFADSKAGTWPSRREDLAAYLRDTYLRRGTAALRANLAQVIVKGTVRPPDDDEVLSARLAQAAHALHDVEPQLLADALRTVVTNPLESGGLTEDEQLRVVGHLGDLTMLWDAVPQVFRPGIVEAVGRRTFEDLLRLRVLSTTHEYAPAAAAVEARLTTELAGVDVLPHRKLAMVVEMGTGRHLLPHAVRELQRASSFRSAETTLRADVLPFAAKLRAEELKEILDAVAVNRQVWDAALTPDLLVSLFEQAPRSEAAMDHWDNLLAKLAAHHEDEEWSPTFAYQPLTTLVAKARIEPAIPEGR